MPAKLRKIKNGSQTVSIFVSRSVVAVKAAVRVTELILRFPRELKNPGGCVSNEMNLLY